MRLTWRSAQVRYPSDALKEPVLFVQVQELRSAHGQHWPGHLSPDMCKSRRRAPCRRILRDIRLTFPAGL